MGIINNDMEFVSTIDMWGGGVGTNDMIAL